LQKFFEEQRPDTKASSLTVTSDILKDEFKMRCRKYDGAIVRYKDPAFVEKRLWACRLLA
jgi:hypothetical protein